MNEAYSMNSKFKFSTCVCTSYGSKLVQDLNGKLLFREQDFQYSNFGAHSKLFHTKKANATMASSMTQATSTGITASKPSSRKERTESLKGLYCVTTDPNDLIQSDNDDKEAQHKMDTKHGHKDPYGKPHHYLQLVKSGY